jgi:hypothetical protein
LMGAAQPLRAPRSHTLVFAPTHGLLLLWRGGGASRRGRVAAWARSADGDQLRAVLPPPAGAEFEVRGGHANARFLAHPFPCMLSP